MKQRFLCCCLLWATQTVAQITIEAPQVGGEFIKNVEGILEKLRHSNNPHLKTLITQVENASQPVVIRAVTDDPLTWMEKSPTRSHTEPAKGYKEKRKKGEAVPAVIYLFPSSADIHQPDYRNGVLTHELVHANDMIYGRYDKSTKVRERRAVVFQNIWRNLMGKKPRQDYHGRFPTSEYEKFKSKGKLDLLAEHILSKHGLPSAKD